MHPCALQLRSSHSCQCMHVENAAADNLRSLGATVVTGKVCRVQSTCDIALMTPYSCEYVTFFAGCGSTVHASYCEQDQHRRAGCIGYSPGYGAMETINSLHMCSCVCFQWLIRSCAL